ncbi:hypothetical protein ACFV1L_10560 [Kitasatospora sp. NPDC059646]|uniref:hypothetical protein n=1 Tax=Kitasatospora sp. NPDC059646 TaxID=3346893 RepID=UPI0036952C3B
MTYQPGADDLCTATYTPSATDDPMSCTLEPHPISPYHESVREDYPGCPLVWRDGVPGSTLPTARLAEAWELEEGDVISYRDHRLTVGEVIRDGTGVEIRTVSGSRIVVESSRQFLAQRV